MERISTCLCSHTYVHAQTVPCFCHTHTCSCFTARRPRTLVTTYTDARLSSTQPKDLDMHWRLDAYLHSCVHVSHTCPIILDPAFYDSLQFSPPCFTSPIHLRLPDISDHLLLCSPRNTSAPAPTTRISFACPPGIHSTPLHGWSPNLPCIEVSLPSAAINRPADPDV